MEWDSEKQPRVGSPDEIQVLESQVQVVVYDEDQEPPEALAVRLEDAIATEVPVEPPKPPILLQLPDAAAAATTTTSSSAINELSQPKPTPSTDLRAPPVAMRPTTPSRNQQGENGFDCLLCGNTRLKRLRPGFHFIMALFGNTYLDLHQETLPPGSTITMISIRLCGNIVALVPPGTRVIVRRIMLCGNRDIDVADDPEEDPTQPSPRLIVYILSLCGDVRARSNPDDIGTTYFS